MTGSDSAPDILIVDDTPANLETLAGMLKERGYKVRPAPNGKLALQAAKTAPPDLVLLDITMPGLDGYQVCARLKRDDRMADVPVIFISALTETIDKVHAFAVGGVDYITKPFQFEEVDARVAVHLKLRRLQLDLATRNRELQQTNNELRRLQELRDNLTHMIIHDLRSPLTGVLGTLELLKTEAGKLTEETRRLLAVAHGAMDQMIAMINSLLDVSRIEAGELRPQKMECDLLEIVRSVVEMFASLRGKRTITIDSAFGSLPMEIDRELISRVIQNLLGNALKFTARNGNVTIRLTQESREVVVSVIDDGPGIAPEHHQRIFEKFGQVQTGLPVVGTGLGLTFCKLAVEAHGGTMGVASELGKGSSFWFRLPMGEKVINGQ